MNTGLNHVFETVSVKLTKAGADCLLIGGFAVNYYGYTRNTLDVDFMIAADDIEIVRPIMIQAGYSNVSESDNACFFNAPNEALRVDFLRVDQQTMLKLLENAKTAVVYGHNIKLPRLNDLLAMKLFALKQGWARRVHKDLPDITNLALVHGIDCEKTLKPLCMEYADTEIYGVIVKEMRNLG